MGIERTFVVSGINVVLHPHSPEKYISLFRKAYALRHPISSRGTQHLMIGELMHLVRNEPMQGLKGRIFRFDHIDPDLPWFNLATYEEASDDEMSQIAIPENLAPNLVSFEFLFYPHTHKLYFVSRFDRYTLSARTLNRFLEDLFSIPELLSLFGPVELTVIPDRQQLERILALHRLSKLTIDVTRPNPDDNEADAERIFRRMERQGIRRVVQEYTAASVTTITPDAETLTLARVAEDNGKVTAVGYDDLGERQELSTVDSPWKEPVSYDTDNQTFVDAFLGFVQRLRHER